MKKKILTAMLAMAMAVSLAACGGSSSSDKASSSSSSTDSVSEEASTEETDATEEAFDYTKLTLEDMQAMELGDPAFTTDDLRNLFGTFDAYEKNYGEILEIFNGVLPDFMFEFEGDVEFRWSATDSDMHYITIFFKPGDDGFYLAKSSSFSNPD